MGDTSKPQYRTLVKALDELYRWVDHLVLNPSSRKEIKDSYKELYQASQKAEVLVRRAKAAIKQKGSTNPTDVEP